MSNSAIRHAIRRLWHDRSLTVAAVAVLALGIGANAALFSVVDAVLLEPLPYPAARRLVAVRIFTPGFQERYPSVPVNAAHFAVWRQHCGSCEGFAIISGMTTTMTGGGESELLEGATVNSGFFELFGIQPALGRTFTPAEEQPGSNKVAVIGHASLVHDVLFTYLPYWLRGASSASLVLRTSVPPASLGDTVRRAIRDVDAGVAIPRVETMDAAVALSVADRKFQLELMIAFGGAAALLTAFGVFGVVSYSVARREREMGIRIALGAAPRDIRRLVIAEGVFPVVAGLGVGLVLSGWIGSALAASLFAVRPGDPLVLGAATLTLLLATLAACAGPALRATRISPAGSLRA